MSGSSGYKLTWSLRGGPHTSGSNEHTFTFYDFIEQADGLAKVRIALGFNGPTELGIKD